jgi:hypothetical protein
LPSWWAWKERATRHMPDIGYDVLVNILATVTVAFLVLLLRIPSLLMMLVGRRRRKLRFFGIVGPDARQRVYLSTLFVRRFGASNYTMEPRSFSGPAVPSYEFAALEILHELWREPTLENLPKLLRPTLRRLSWRLQPVQLDSRSSPRKAAEVEFGGSIVAVGGQHYNVATKLFLDTLQPYVTISDDGESILLIASEDSIIGNTSDEAKLELEDYGILQRLFHPPTNTTALIVAGLGTTGTTGAAYYLANNWHDLSKRFGREPFAVCLGFKNVRSNPNSFLEPVVIFTCPDHQ